MRNKSNPQPIFSNPPLPTVEPNTAEQETKSKQNAIIEAKVREALYPPNPRYKIMTTTKSGKP